MDCIDHPMDSVRQNAKALFLFLKEFTQLRMRAVRDVDQYDHVLWIKDIPKQEGCLCAAWNFGRDDPEQTDTWLEIHKPKLPPPPPPEASLKPWLVAEHIDDSSREMPDLRPEISLSVDSSGVSGDAFRTHRLDDHPEIKKAWERYVENKWWPWAENDRRLQPVQRPYDDLFFISRRQQQLGEQYEVVLGLGLLSWKTPDGQIIRRHLIAAQTSIEFEPKRGVIRVVAAGEGARPTLEQDMLDPSDRPEPTQLAKLEAEVSSIGDDIWDRTKLGAALKAWAHGVRSKGVYDESLTLPERATNDPLVHLAPAIILRKRTERSFVRVFQEIVQQLDEGANIPPGLQHFVMPADKEVDADGRKESPLIEVSEVYFPLEANEAQRDIVARLRNRQGIVVQGPPGTGKSHTIVNLISHLLASGKRILVTSHGPRALKVLRRFFKERVAEVAPLAVVLLGDDSDSFEAMETSVQGIVDRYNQWDPAANARVISEAEKRLDAARKNEAAIRNELLAIREKETYEHPRIFHTYSGTLQRIGEKVRAQGDEYDWHKDSPAENLDPPLTNQEVQTLLSLLRDQSVSHGEADHGQCFDPSQSLVPAEFASLVEAERDSLRDLEATNEAQQHPNFQGLLSGAQNERSRLRGDLVRFTADVEHVNPAGHAWVGQMLIQTLSGQEGTWRELLSSSRQHLAAIGERARWSDETIVSGLGERDLNTVKSEAAAMLERLEAGGGWGAPLFRPKIAKNALYLRDNVRVGGRPCESAPEIRELISWIDTLLHFRHLRELWQPYARIRFPARAQQASAYGDLCKPLERGLALLVQLSAIKETLQHFRDAPEPIWHERDSVRALLRAIEAAEAELAVRRYREKFKGIAESLENWSRSHRPNPAVGALLNVVRARNKESYAQARKTLEDIWESYQKFLLRHHLMERLATAAPILAKALESSPNDNAWNSRSAQFQDAWNWARARTWIKRLSDPSETERLRLNLDREQSAIRSALQKIAALKAWKHCFDRISEHERQHLIAWSQAMRKIGKGTGKYAPVHRRAAREHMEECRTAIPAWVMPLYRVVETMRPGKDMFDVAIIDEASQSGPEALVLTYMAKQIVVVGDDKQISPESVGIDREDVIRLRARHIANLPHNDRYGADDSFFDLADIFFPGRIRLREHFRCMPEIIQFSNDLCYQTPPLIPLRQYGTARLRPIVTTWHVNSGYVEASAHRRVNKAEAEALVDRLVTCDQDAAYKGKSFGVISLLGADQARLIEQLLQKRLGNEVMQQRQVVCGDAYAFQGDERDVIFLSMVSAPSEGHRIGVLGKETDKRRFNVAASRARDQMILFHSVTLNDLNPNCLRHRLLRYCSDPRVSQPPIAGIPLAEWRHIAANVKRDRDNHPEPFESWFELDVFLLIAARGYRVIPQYEVAGKRIDLVVEGMNGRLAVECDGDSWHGPDVYQQDMARQRMLERCGCIFWRVRGSAFGLDPIRALESLWETLKRQNIYPVGQEPPTNGVPPLSDGPPPEIAETTTSPPVPDVRIAPTTSPNIIDFPQKAIWPTVSTGSVPISKPRNDRPNVAVVRKPLPIEAPHAQPYREWHHHPLPDPKTADPTIVLQGLAEIIESEGPMLAMRAFGIYAHAAGIRKVGRIVRSYLNQALSAGLRKHTIVAEREHVDEGQLRLIVRTHNSPPVVVRSLGPRTFLEIPPSEVAEVMRKLAARDTAASADTLFRAVLDHYGLVRMTAQVADELRRIHGRLPAGGHQAGEHQ